ncbi:MAG: dTDP-4-dehydrorhamnose 3,5-epimerase [Tannerellaceae bacterium]|jgi:dTDP-4-dehydrorhamnose 3,5-epimerase|nr:dTDP-4-dehydrorhamnose 3,5-epimerase [Tannerellaceae bacterium]
MRFTPLDISGLWLIEPHVFLDERGYFMESFRAEDFREHIGDVVFVQENESRSVKNVLRGLHYQREPYTQSKLIRVVSGEVLDVAVDIRPHSPTYGKHAAVLLSGDNKLQFFIPRGFAHGFKVLSDTAIFQYKVDNPYAPAGEGGILYNDPTLAIDWQLSPDNPPLLSPKDRAWGAFPPLT